MEAVTYYEEFAEYVKGESVGVEQGLCGSAKRVVQGDVELLTRPVKRAEEAVVDDGVDWGISAVDFLTEGESCGDRLGYRDRDLLFGAGGSAAQAGGIDWNDAGEGVVEASAGAEATLEPVADDEGEACTLVDAKSRELYLNDLIELDAFLAQRIAELSRPGDSEIGLVTQQSSSTPEFVSSVDAERVRVLQDRVRAGISAINCADTRRVLTLQSDPNRVERAARMVLEKKHVAERMHAAIDVLRKRRANAVEELAVENPRLEDLSRVTRDVKRRTEMALSKLYKGRTVNILGEINNVFPPVD